MRVYKRGMDTCILTESCREMCVRGPACVLACLRLYVRAHNHVSHLRADITFDHLCGWGPHCAGVPARNVAWEEGLRMLAYLHMRAHVASNQESNRHARANTSVCARACPIPSFLLRCLAWQHLAAACHSPVSHSDSSKIFTLRQMHIVYLCCVRHAHARALPTSATG